MKFRTKTSLIALLFATGASYAQINMPVPSPASTVIQKFGLAEIKVDYFRPSMNGIKIFGNVVPYDSISEWEK